MNTATPSPSSPTPAEDQPGAQAAQIWPDAELFDISEWPIAFGHFPELDAPDRVRRMLGSLDAILDRKQRFVLVWIPARHDHDDEPHEDEKQSMIWLKRRKVELRERCAGYVYITTDPALRALLTARFDEVARLLPFPKLLANDRAEARRLALTLL